MSDNRETDIIEHARAIKEYCKAHDCEYCDFAEHKVIENTDNYICRVHYSCPCAWELPESEEV